MPDPLRVSWLIERWHSRMDDDMTALVEGDFHNVYILRNVLERVERPLMGMRLHGFRVRMARVVNG